MNSFQANSQHSYLIRNSIFNLIGYLIPLIIAVFTIPIIISAIGTDRFGILTLAWVVIGYLSLLDFGLGRTITKFVSEKIGDNYYEDIPVIIWTALATMIGLAVIVGVIFSFCSHWIVFSLLNVPEELTSEVYLTFLIIAALMPIVILSVGFRGVLEAYQRFDLVNAVRIPLGIFSFAIPLAIIPWSVKLPFLVLGLFLVRLFAMLVQFYFCRHIVENLKSGFAIRFDMLPKLMRFGGWMTITNIINPLLVYLDRFFIGSLLSITFVAYYATPNEIITKLTLISASLMNVIFPSIASHFKSARQYSAFLLDQSLKYIFILLFPIVFVITCFAPEALSLWLDVSFFKNSVMVTRLFAIGSLFACLGQIPYAFIHGAGRPEYTGVLHLIELPLYLTLLFFAIKWKGINGAAMVWVLRFAIDTVCMYVMAQKILGPDKLRTFSKFFSLILALISLSLIFFAQSFIFRLVYCFLVFISFSWVAIRFIFSLEEKKFFKQFILKHPPLNSE